VGTTLIIVLASAAGALAVAAVGWFAVFVPWGRSWGTTLPERDAAMTGDDWFDAVEGPLRLLRMTRAITVDAAPDQVWPWLAQLGRGAGFYAIDALDNGRKPSAEHLVSWVPAPRRGDATAIGYLRHIEPGVELAWWLRDDPFMGATTSMATCLRLAPEGEGTRVVFRITGGGRGMTTPLVMQVFTLIDTIMMISQLKGLKRRVEAPASAHEAAAAAETGARDQYQQYELIYGDGSVAGVEGSENGARWRELAIRELGGRIGQRPAGAEGGGDAAD
jgi:hypothetical protein